MRDRLFDSARELRDSCGGRATQRDNLHLTLVFLGDVAREKIPQLMAIAGEQYVPAFKLEFGTVRYWPHNRIVWAAPRSVPPALSELVIELESALEEAEFDFDRRPYVPHVTLLRGARPPTVTPNLRFDWPVQDFALVEAVRDPRGMTYQALARWDAAA